MSIGFSLQQTTAFSLEAEQALLGAILMNNALYANLSKTLKSEHFYEPIHGQLWALIGQAIEADLDANPITLKPYIATLKIGDISAYAYLLRLCSQTVGTAPARDFAKTIVDCAMRAKLCQFGETIKNRALNARPNDNVAQLIIDTENELSSLKDHALPESLSASTNSALDQLMASYQSRIVTPTISLPLNELHDVLSSDLEAGNLYGLLSSSGEGKTSLALQIIDHASAQGHPVIFFSYDQSQSQCLMQIASQRLKIQTRHIREQALSPRDEKRYFDELAKLRQNNLRIINCTVQTIHQIGVLLKAELKRQKSDRVALVVVDHVRKITPTNPHAHEGRIAAEIGGSAKALARQHQLVWLNIMQRKSLKDTRENPHPTEADLFGGEQAREDYDAIIYLYRPEKYREFRLARASSERKRDAIDIYLEKWRGYAKLGALKVRFGDPTIWRALQFEAQYTRYSSSHNQDQPLLQGMNA